MWYPPYRQHLQPPSTSADVYLIYHVVNIGESPFLSLWKANSQASEFPSDAKRQNFRSALHYHHVTCTRKGFEFRRIEMNGRTAWNLPCDGLKYCRPNPFHLFTSCHLAQNSRTDYVIWFKSRSILRLTLAQHCLRVSCLYRVGLQ